MLYASLEGIPNVGIGKHVSRRVNEIQVITRNMCVYLSVRIKLLSVGHALN